VFNLISGVVFSFLLFPTNLGNSCNDYVDNHPVRSEIMMQVVLKSYGYYEGKIDGIFGNLSKNALIPSKKLTILMQMEKLALKHVLYC